MQARFGFARQDVDAAGESSGGGVERSAVHHDAFDLGEVDVERRWIHPVGTGAVQGVTVDAQGQVVPLLAAQHDVVGDPPLAYLVDTRQERERLSGVAGEALADLPRPESVVPGRFANLDALGEDLELEGEDDGAGGVVRQVEHGRRRTAIRWMGDQTTVAGLREGSEHAPGFVGDQKIAPELPVGTKARRRHAAPDRRRDRRRGRRVCGFRPGRRRERGRQRARERSRTVRGAWSASFPCLRRPCELGPRVGVPRGGEAAPRAADTLGGTSSRPWFRRSAGRSGAEADRARREEWRRISAARRVDRPSAEGARDRRGGLRAGRPWVP